MPNPPQIAKEFDVETELFVIRSLFRGFISKSLSVKQISPTLRM